MSLLAGCWANQVNAWMYLKDVIERLPTHPTDRLEDLLPHRWIKHNPNAELPTTVMETGFPKRGLLDAYVRPQGNVSL